MALESRTHECFFLLAMEGQSLGASSGKYSVQELWHPLGTAPAPDTETEKSLREFRVHCCALIHDSFRKDVLGLGETVPYS